MRSAIEARGWILRQPVDLASFKVALQQAADEGFDRLVIAGGDGTVHFAVNSFGHRSRPAIALLPLGTGNDLARTLAIPLDPIAALAIAEKGRVRRIDTVSVHGDSQTRLINAATGGFAGQVTAKLTASMKQSWGAMAYVRQAAEIAFNPPRWSVRIRCDRKKDEEFEIVNIAVANGRTAGGGFMIAPRACLEDGWLDIVLVQAASMLDHTVVTARILAGDYDLDEVVRVRRARRLELWATPPIPFSFDGEECIGSHFVFTVERKAIAMVVGPGYRKRVGRLASFAAVVFHFLAQVGIFLRGVLRILTTRSE